MKSEREAFHEKLKRVSRRAVQRDGIEGLRPHIRQEDGQGPIVIGYATVYDTPYEVWDWLGSYTEIMAQGAATKTLAEAPDVRYLINHDGVPLARTKSGTLRLFEDEVGMGYETEPLDMRNPRVAEIVSAMEREDAAESSMMFRVVKNDWSPDYEQRTIREISMHDGDVSTVTFPANAATTSGLRSLDLVEALSTAADLDALLVEARGRDDLTTTIAAAADRLSGVLEQLRAGRPDPAAADPPPQRDIDPTLSVTKFGWDLDLILAGSSE